jgi:hypothetical protein
MGDLAERLRKLDSHVRLGHVQVPEPVWPELCAVVEEAEKSESSEWTSLNASLRKALASLARCMEKEGL